MANETNVIVQSGYCTEPKTGTARNGRTFLDFALGQTFKERDYERRQFVPVVFYGKRAEGLRPYIKKGMHLTITGELRVEPYESNGQKRTKVYLAGDKVNWGAPPGRDNGSSPQANGQQQHVPAGGPAPTGPLADEDIPY